MAMGFRGALVLALISVACCPALAAPEDLANFFEEAVKLKGKTLSIRSSNGPVRQGMSAEINVLDPLSYDIVTTIKEADGSVTPFARDTYRFHLNEKGLVEGHFRTEYTRASGRSAIPLVCDSFLFLSSSLQMDCYEPQNFRPERQATRLEFSAVWQLRPESFDIRIISNAGAATLSLAR
jgi:hypothetical protein